MLTPSGSGLQAIDVLEAEIESMRERLELTVESSLLINNDPEALLDASSPPARPLPPEVQAARDRIELAGERSARSSDRQEADARRVVAAHREAEVRHCLSLRFRCRSMPFIALALPFLALLLPARTPPRLHAFASDHLGPNEERHCFRTRQPAFSLGAAVFGLSPTSWVPGMVCSV